jgi:hypothetical protein
MKVNPYPHKFEFTVSIPEFVTQYSHLEADKRLEGEVVSIAGFDFTSAHNKVVSTPREPVELLCSFMMFEQMEPRFKPFAISGNFLPTELISKILSQR